MVGRTTFDQDDPYGDQPRHPFLRPALDRVRDTFAADVLRRLMRRHDIPPAPPACTMTLGGTWDTGRIDAFLPPAEPATLRLEGGLPSPGVGDTIHIQTTDGTTLRAFVVDHRDDDGTLHLHPKDDTTP